MTAPEPNGNDGTPVIGVSVRRGDPSEEELAAVVAVVSEAYAAEEQAAVADDSAARSTWEISARGLRTPLQRGVPWSRSLF